MKLWHKFTEKLPETYKELVLRSNEYGLYSYQSAMSVQVYDFKNKESHVSIEHGLCYDDVTYNPHTYCAMREKFRADKEENIEWCYLEDLCKTLENSND